MAEEKNNRHGKHDPDKVLLGGYVTPEFKALAQLVANTRKCNVHEILQEGVYTLATISGIMKDGKILPEYQIAIDALADIIRTNRNKRRG